MVWISRALEPRVRDQLQTGSKVIVLLGARQVGKTSLMNRVIGDTGKKTLELSGDDASHIALFVQPEISRLKHLVEGYQIVFVDEAQRIPEIGLAAKILHDHVPDVRVILSGSSSFELSGRIREPLTGRTITNTLYPVWTGEYANERTPFEQDDLLSERLVYGDYPEPATTETLQTRRERVEEIAHAYLFRDVMQLGGLLYPERVIDLARLLAFQVGNEVSYEELATQVHLSRETVRNYIHALEQAFVLFRVRGFGRNLRKEVTKKPKIYFWDLGIRNALIQRWEPLDQRDDVGALWENFLVAERKKANTYGRLGCNHHFWRVYTGAEIDLVEECGSKLSAFEFKWRSRGKRKTPPATWTTTYPDATFETVDRDNWLDFCMGTPAAGM